MADLGIRLFNNIIQFIGNTENNQPVETIVTTISDNQECAEIRLYILERKKNLIDCEIGMITVCNIPPMKAGAPEICVKIALLEGNVLDLMIRINKQQESSLRVPWDNWHEKNAMPALYNLAAGNKPAVNMPGIMFSNNINEEDSGNIALYPSYALSAKGRTGLFGIITGTMVICAIGITALIVSGLWSFPGTGNTPRDTNRSIAANLTQVKKAGTGTGTKTGTKTGQKSAIAATVRIQTVQTQILTVTATSPPVITAPPLIIKTRLPVTKTPIQATTSPVLAARTTDNSASTTPGQLDQNDIKALNAQIGKILPFHFYPDSTKLLPSSVDKIDKLAELLSGYRNKVKVKITGHTADAGSTESQILLSVERAQFIKDELMKRAAITNTQSQILGKGISEPVYTGDEAEKLYLNRRVEITVSITGEE